MTIPEMESAIKQLKAEGHGEEEILGAFYKMFQDDKLTLDELDGIVNLMGYHLTDEFKAMSPEDQKTKGYEEVDEPAEGVDKEDIEDAKEAESDEEPEKEESEPEDKGEEDSDDENEGSEEDEDEEAKAMKLFGTK